MATVLILEDELSLLKLVRHMLRQYVLIEATTAQEALRCFQDSASSIGVLVADVTLPISSGIQVALTLRRENPALPVILTSGYPLAGWSDRDAADFEKLESASTIVLQKPFERRLLINAINKLVGDSALAAGA